MIMITVSRCLGLPNCKTEEEINKRADETNFVVGPINRYFDFNDYVTPIKSYYDDTFTYSVAPGLHKTAILFVRRTTVEMNDSLIQLGDTKKEQYYHLTGNKMDLTLEEEDGVLMTIFIQQDPIEDLYNRRVYSLFDLTGQLGGLFGIMKLIGAFIV